MWCGTAHSCLQVRVACLRGNSWCAFLGPAPGQAGRPLCPAVLAHRVLKYALNILDVAGLVEAGESEAYSVPEGGNRTVPMPSIQGLVCFTVAAMSNVLGTANGPSPGCPACMGKPQPP